MAELTPDAAQGIIMALHELRTNAAKYGALSNDAGTVPMSWQVTRGANPMFSIFWLERGGLTFQPPTRPDFGKALIGRKAHTSVQGATEIAVAQSSVSWSLNAPSANVLTRSNVSRT